MKVWLLVRIEYIEDYYRIEQFVGIFKTKEFAEKYAELNLDRLEEREITEHEVERLEKLKKKEGK